MNQLVRDFRDFFVSLKLTVVLLVLGMVLVFAATLDQVNLGVWAVQAKYFRSLFVLWRVGDIPVPVFPGGYLIGGLLLINLVAAHLYRFKFTWKKTGILLAHFGLILLLVGELLTSLWQQEYNMRLDEGETKNYAESYQHVELAITDITDAKTDEVVSIPEWMLQRRETVQYAKLPFRVVVKDYYPNASLMVRPGAMTGLNEAPTPATMGIGLRMLAVPEAITYKENERNTPAAFVDLEGPQGSIGTWMVSAQIPTPQHFDYAGRKWKIALRFRRQYNPFTVTLLKFSHDVYPGTDIPKNFSSRVRVVSDDGRDNREVLIYMNNPLRYRGLTFYQSGYDGEHTTILQVVHNPSWRLPYIACTLVAIGLVFQFGLHLFGFLGKRRRKAAAGASGVAAGHDRGDFGVAAGASAGVAAPALPWLQRYLPAFLLVGAIVAIGWSLLPPRNPTAFDTVGFGRLPVLANGRFKPLDTVARSSLLQIEGNQDITLPDQSTITPTEWLLDVVFNAKRADTFQIFKIVHPDVLTLFDLKPADGRNDEYFSFNQLSKKLDALEDQAKLAEPIESSQRSPFQRGVLQLYNSLVLYQQLRHMFVMPGADNFLGQLFRLQEKLVDGVDAIRAKQAGKPHDEALVTEIVGYGQEFSEMAGVANALVIPPVTGDADPNKWQTTGAALLDTFQNGRINPAALAYAGLGRAWNDHTPDKFNKLLSLFRGDLQKRYAPQLQKSDAEARFNAAQPFYLATSLYVLAFVLAVVSWLVWPEALGKAAFWLIGVAWILTTAGILTRMWLEGRPPVTNLYSSALFVGWGAVALCLGLEYTFRNAIGSAAGAAIGFATLVIAHMLSLSGDTLEMMRAVLDSNFWLATHVVVVTLGYASTFLAGFLAIIYVVRGVFTRSLDKVTADSLTRMVYGIVCFATLFSFAGTVLGGIWADQSWGRFWGWDPKENGAFIIVVWNAILLHARWGGMVKQRGIMALAIFGNIVTSWSWFGTNMLGIGLHSYGFTEAAFWGLSAFMATQLALIAIANIPLDRWVSFRPKATRKQEPVLL